MREGIEDGWKSGRQPPPPSPSEHTWKSFLPFLAAAPAGASVLQCRCNAEAATEVPSVSSGAPWVPVGEPAYAGGLALLPVSCSCGSSSHPSVSTGDILSVILYHPLMLSAPASTEMHFRALIALLGRAPHEGGGGSSGFLPHDCLCVWFQLISCDADGSSSCKHCGRVSNVPGLNGNEATVSCVRVDLSLF